MKVLALLAFGLLLTACEQGVVVLPIEPSGPKREEEQPVLGDEDLDGVFGTEDNCPALSHPDQTDADADGLGNACDLCPNGEDLRDADMDGFHDCEDRCIEVASQGNEDSDGDGVGDACDVCPNEPDLGQSDRDNDGVGDACEETLPFTIEEASVAQVLAALKASELTCEALVEMVLSRIQRYDLDITQGPPLHAFVSFNERVRSQARALDAHFEQTGKLKGELHCVPLVIKDNYDSRDTPTSSGSLALVDVQAPRDGYAVGRLRDAGAILIGTTNMDELAKGVFGISSRTGRTGNAYDPWRNPGGSSAGTATALAASFAVLGTGTDNCSSLTLPAAYAGLITIRATYGLVSLDGVFPSNRLDAVAGPMARSVRDLTLMLDYMAGVDENDARTALAQRPESYLPFLDEAALRRKRIGILRKVGRGEEASFPFGNASVDTLHTLIDTTRVLETLGAEVVDNISLSALSRDRSSGGFASDVDRYLSEVDSPFDTFADVCETGRFAAFTYESRDACLGGYEGSPPSDSRAYQEDARRYRDNAAYVEGRMEELGLDALLYPVDAFGPARVSAVSSNCAISSVTGLPTMVIAVGHANDGMPIGMQLLGKRFSEGALLGMAYAFEQATRVRRAPVLRAAANGEPGRFELGAENKRRLALGEASFDQVLKTGERTDLDAETFRDLVDRVLTE